MNEPICVVAQFGYSGEEFVFQGLGCITDFCEWLFECCENNAETLQQQRGVQHIFHPKMDRGQQSKNNGHPV